MLFGSYGTYYLIFSAGPGEASGQVRKLAIGADTQQQAVAQLGAMDDVALGHALADATDFDATSPLGF
ncbi:hypothetical protein SPICUR_04015 [Spiribacter curvatus]|uniref:Uncharacterized protein n=1 Tax=Spiribacter curvatus TaxID=1335757 RepID=U5T2Y2_9GAMM|nr:hypothetical protein SPICUR_04015 [Spiribacter curvatus]